MAFPRHQTTRHRRGGARFAAISQLVREIDAAVAETLPVGGLTGLVFDEYSECQWKVILPGTVTTADVTVCRLAEAPGIAAIWIKDETVTMTESGTIYQYSSGDRVQVYIDNVTGTGTIAILCKGVEKGA